MSFSTKQGKPNLPKILVLLAIAIAIVAVIFIVTGKKNEAKTPDQNQQEAVEIVPSGLDKGKSVDDVGDVEEVIAKWIEANPKAILSSVASMQRKMAEQQMKEAQKNIGAKKSEIFNDKDSAQYAPEGYDVTIVEFFDYACGFCKKAHATVEELIQEDKKVRVIYKDFPILGQPSQEMAIVSVAVQIAEPKSYKKFHDALMKSHERSKDGAIKIAKSVGVNVSKVEDVLKKQKDQINKILQNNLELGSSIGVTGTPGFIIGEELLPGAVELGSFKEKIAEVRSKK